MMFLIVADGCSNMVLMKQPFSAELEAWLKAKGPHTIDSLTKVFEEKSFAVITLVLMFIPALPIPTAGITHIFELIVMLLSIELMLGRRTVWLPRFWLNKSLGRLAQSKVLPSMVRRIRWFERYSRPRMSGLINNPMFLRLIGVLFFCQALAAFIVVPGVGLDTLPSLGAVIIALSLILGDIVLFIIGCIVGLTGIGLVVVTGSLTLHYFERVMHIITTRNSS